MFSGNTGESVYVFSSIVGVGWKAASEEFLIGHMPIQVDVIKLRHKVVETKLIFFFGHLPAKRPANHSP